MHRVLIANRGEIALRIIRACHEEGLEAVAVYSAADRASPHVRAADRARRRSGPPAPSRELSRHRAPASRPPSDAGADAVHPGYGFLAERAAFAEAVRGGGAHLDRAAAVSHPRHGRQDRGPAAHAATRACRSCPGAQRAGATTSGPALGLAREVGYPVHGEGGGRRGREGHAGGAHAGASWPARSRPPRSEALKAFGDASVYLEKLIERPRHVEIQVLADASRTMHLGERECSIQRRHQKLVEEAPSVAVDAELREWMGAAAVVRGRGGGVPRRRHLRVPARARPARSTSSR